MGEPLIDRPGKPPGRPPAKQSRRSQAERREASEARLLLAAAALIAEEGFAAASLQRIGTRAGYSRGLASQHFGSKDGLMQALIAAVIARSTALLAGRAKPGANASGPLAAILAYADVILQQIEHDPLIRAYWVMMASAIANRLPSQAIFRAEHEKVKTELATLIEAGQACGDLDPALDPEAAALAIGSTLLGIGIECLLDKTLDLPRVRTAALASIERSLTRPV